LGIDLPEELTDKIATKYSLDRQIKIIKSEGQQGADRQWRYSLSPEHVAVIEKKASTWLVERRYPLSTELSRENFSEGSATRKKRYLSICAIRKNEAPYLVEWIEFHQIVGVERFYLYDIGLSTDRPTCKLRDF